jgi:negative regulator of flagellin synthesis FlgM
MTTKLRGSNMKVPSVGSPPESAGVAPATAVAPARTTGAAPSPAPAVAPLESAVLGPALAAIGELPEIDRARVASLRDALEQGQIPFDASKLAALIDRYHRTGQ